VAGLDIDPESIHSGADGLDAAKEQVQGMFDQFQSAAEGLADAFGGDEIGMLLGIAHQACLDAALECFSTNLDDLADYAVSLREMADNHLAADDETAAIFEQLLGELGA
jgi:hypothetical protein